jgi:hypothetical protein
MTPPHVTQKLLGKVATLERRADHLQRQLDNWQSSSGAREFASAERSALEAAIVCMKLHYAEAEGMDQPMKVLRDLIAYLEKKAKPDAELTQLLERASVALTEFEAPGDTGQEGKSHDENRGKGLRTVG